MARLIIIEDDAELQHLLGFTLYKQGYECTYAFNGKEGYEKVLANPPDLILLDLMLPVLSGAEVITMVMAHPVLRHVPIIVMTGYGGDVDKVEKVFRDQGVREYIRKPLVLEDLVRCIKRVLAENPMRPPEEPLQVSKGNVRLDLRLRTVWIDDKLVATLPPQRAELLKILLENSGPVTKDKLVAQIWGESKGDFSALEKAIQRLREDLGPEARARIQTGAEGYEFLA